MISLASHIQSLSRVNLRHLFFQGGLFLLLNHGLFFRPLQKLLPRSIVGQHVEDSQKGRFLDGWIFGHIGSLSEGWNAVDLGRSK